VNFPFGEWYLDGVQCRFEHSDVLNGINVDLTLEPTLPSPPCGADCHSEGRQQVSRPTLPSAFPDKVTAHPVADAALGMLIRLIARQAARELLENPQYEQKDNGDAPVFPQED
jgi:hypothetical protein